MKPTEQLHKTKKYYEKKNVWNPRKNSTKHDETNKNMQKLSIKKLADESQWQKQLKQQRKPKKNIAFDVPAF